eukprot:jgi/Psemu1/16367/gm1.16367_g
MTANKEDHQPVRIHPQHLPELRTKYLKDKNVDRSEYIHNTYQISVGSVISHTEIAVKQSVDDAHQSKWLRQRRRKQLKVDRSENIHNTYQNSVGSVNRHTEIAAGRQEQQKDEISEGPTYSLIYSASRTKKTTAKLRLRADGCKYINSNADIEDSARYIQSELRAYNFYQCALSQIRITQGVLTSYQRQQGPKHRPVGKHPQHLPELRTKYLKDEKVNRPEYIHNTYQNSVGSVIGHTEIAAGGRHEQQRDEISEGPN